MSIHRLLRGAALVASAAAIAAPLLNADRKPDGSRSGYADARTAGPFTEPPGSAGWGKGSVVLPVDEQLGSMVGVVQQGDANARYFIQAELTGCMPSAAATGESQYWFGGLYGRVQQIAERESTPGEDTVPWFHVEGMWTLEKGLEGTFAGELYGCNEAGTWYVCGRIEGRFEVSEAMPGPGSLACFKSFGDLRPPDKAKLLPLPGDELRGADTIVCPKGPGVAAVDPPKAPDLPCSKSYLDRRLPDKTKLLPRPGDELRGADTIVCPKGPGVAAIDPPKSPDLPCSAGWRDLRATTPPFAIPGANWPVLTGTFDLRYQLFE